MRKTILSLTLGVVAAVATLNAQQASPSQTTVTQQTSKPKTTGTWGFPRPRVQPTLPTTVINNSLHGKRVANNLSHEKSGAKNPGNGKPANNPDNGEASDSETARGKTTKADPDNYADAMRPYRHERHNCDWWKQHYIVIVLVGGGYYYRDAGYWYPAWGYDLNNERYDYDGPIYTYGNLLPDQVIINVQRVLQQLGYYSGGLNGSLGVDTRRALTAYQQDYGLDATGVVDEATVRSLGLI